MWIADEWREYELIDAGDGERLERWGAYILIRPDPQAVWRKDGGNKLWHCPHARYHRSAAGGGQWEFLKPMPDDWELAQGAYRFKVKPMGFKHMGLFPEQLVNWRWSDRLLRKRGGEVRVLNLFAYTGGATVAAAAAGAFVCHVDAAKGMVQHARENAALSGLGGAGIRYIVDDCMKFVARELRRGSKYDAIILDPPSYGRGPGGEVWKIESALYAFAESCAALLSDRPLFMLLNAYTTGLSAETMRNVLGMTAGKKFGGETRAAEIGIPMRNGYTLPCGASARWEISV
ncbi:MAG: class I SAM-dependent methyltransferase [Clostridiales bacterium]|jgi:23S rRNA (cytosine1962-C5)-methyltransferase|nr:class I SAM-dependent methyltransferase [Clostridiales bacterium]